MCSLKFKTTIDVDGRELHIEVIDMNGSQITGITIDDEYFVPALQLENELKEEREKFENQLNEERKKFKDFFESQLEKPIDDSKHRKHDFHVNDSRIRDGQGRKQCTNCEKWLPEAEFYPSKKTKDGLRSYCKKCFAIGKNEAREKERTEKLQELNKQGFTIKNLPETLVFTNETIKKKVCSKCEKEKPVSEFSPSDKYKSGYLSACKECMSKYQKKHYQDNKKKYARNNEETPQTTKTEQPTTKQEQHQSIPEQTLKTEPITSIPLEKPATRAPDRTALFLTWLKGRIRFDMRDFVTQNKDKITEDEAKKIIYHQVSTCRLLQISATEFKVL